MHTDQKKLMHTAAAARPRVGIRGIAAVTNKNDALNHEAFSRAVTTSVPPRMDRYASQPPKKPPNPPDTGGIHANRRFASWPVMFQSCTKYFVVQFVHKV